MDNEADVALLESAAAAEAPPAPPADLEQVKAKAARLVAIEQELDDLAETEKRLKKEREAIRIHELPEMMFSLEMTLIGVGNKVVEIEPMIQATLPKESTALQAACNWLVDNKEGGVIKRQLNLDLPKGDAVMEAKVVTALNAVDPGLAPRVIPTVHYQTYLALCRRLVQSGKDVPKDVLGIFVGHIARVGSR